MNDGAILVVAEPYSVPANLLSRKQVDMTLRSSLRRAGVVGGTLVVASLAAAPSVQAASTYVEGGNITSIVTIPHRFVQLRLLVA